MTACLGCRGWGLEFRQPTRADFSHAGKQPVVLPHIPCKTRGEVAAAAGVGVGVGVGGGGGVVVAAAAVAVDKVPKPS